MDPDNHNSHDLIDSDIRFFYGLDAGLKTMGLGQLALAVLEAIFQNHASVEIDGETCAVKSASRRKPTKVTVGGHLFVKQNPAESSK